MRVLALLPLCHGWLQTARPPPRLSPLSATISPPHAEDDWHTPEEWVNEVVDEVIAQSSTHCEDDPYHAAADAPAADDAGARLAAMDADARIAALEERLARQGDELKAARRDARTTRRRLPSSRRRTSSSGAPAAAAAVPEEARARRQSRGSRRARRRRHRLNAR